MNENLFMLLRRRMADEQVGPDEPVAVAELHKRLLPYHTCRDRLGFATKAEYDVALLRLLADERCVAVTEPALREAVQSEIRQPEPGLAFLQRFAASEIRLKEVPGPAAANDEGSAAGSNAGKNAEGPSCRRCAAALPAAEGARFCPRCGADQVVPTCGECGAEVEEGWRYCAFCGSLQEVNPT